MDAAGLARQQAAFEAGALPALVAALQSCHNTDWPTNPVAPVSRITPIGALEFSKKSLLAKELRCGSGQVNAV